MRPASQRFYERDWTLWDCFTIDTKKLGKELTMQGFIDYFKEKENLEITMISQGVCMLYAFFQPPNKREERMKMEVSKVVETVSKKPIAPHVRALVLEICCNDDTGEDVEVSGLVIDFIPLVQA